MANNKNCLQTRDVVLFVTFVLAVLTQVFADDRSHPNISDVDRLINEKRAGYNVFLRPTMNQSEPLVIEMAFDLIAIRDFDEVSERFSVVGTIYMIWKDDRMVWDPEDYGNLYHFITEHRDFWVPTLVLVNAFEQFEKVGAEDYWPMRFYHSGYVLYHPGQVFTTTCSVNVALYPFDTQSCIMLYSIWAHDVNEISLQSYDGLTKVSLTYFGDNGEWDLIDTNAAAVSGNLFYFEFVIKRKPLFIILNTLLPIIFMSFLNILAFLIPIDSGERLSYCITVLLAVAVFLTIIGDSLPKSATTIAVLCYYLVCVLALSMFIIIGTIINMRIHMRDEGVKVSQCWNSFVNFMKCRSCRSRKYKRYEKRTQSRTKSPTNSEFRLYRGNDAPGRTQNGHTVYINSISGMNHKLAHEHSLRMNNDTTLYQTNDLDDDRNSDSIQERENKEYTWKDVSGALDILFFIISFVALACFTATFFIYTMVSGKNEM